MGFSEAGWPNLLDSQSTFVLPKLGAIPLAFSPTLCGSAPHRSILCFENQTHAIVCAALNQEGEISVGVFTFPAPIMSPTGKSTVCVLCYFYSRSHSPYDIASLQLILRHIFELILVKPPGPQHFLRGSQAKWFCKWCLQSSKNIQARNPILWILMQYNHASYCKICTKAN